MSILYDRIEKFSRAKGMSVSAVCKKANVSSGSISELKTGKRKEITIETATKIAYALDIPVGALFGGPLTHETIITDHTDVTKFPVANKDNKEPRPFMQKLMMIEEVFKNIAVETMFSTDDHSLIVRVTARNTGKELSFKNIVPKANDFDEAFELMGDEIINFIVTAASTLNTSDDE